MELPYWSTNLIKDNLDIFLNMSVLDVQGKTKHNAKARADLLYYTCSPELLFDTERKKMFRLLQAT